MESICWNCQNACGRCSWSHNFEPVKNWQAKKTKIKNASSKNFESFKVINCPEYKEDVNRQKILDFCKRMKKAENTVINYLSDNVLSLSDLDSTDKSYIRRKIYCRRKFYGR